MPHQLRYWMARNPALQTDILAIVIHAIASFYLRKAVIEKGIKNATTGSVTMIQRFGSVLNLNLHFHSLFFDGVYTKDTAHFHLLSPPADNEVVTIVQDISRRVLRYLRTKGYLTEHNQTDAHDELLQHDNPVIAACMAASVQSRIALGPHAGQKIRTRVGVWATASDPPELQGHRCATVNSFNLHANLAVQAHQRKLLEKVCRYILRPPVATDRLFLLSSCRACGACTTSTSSGLLAT